MDPVEAGDWLIGRPKQLVFLTGLDPANKKTHNTLVNTFGSTTSDRQLLNLRVVSGELDLPSKREKTVSKGILRRDWPVKYLNRVPSIIVLFLNLDWDHPSWNEKKTEAESKCESIRASCRQGSRLAVVLLQDRSLPTPSDDPLATERAHELCQICHLSPKQLFVVPLLGDLQGYVVKLEAAFHELAQGFYQQKLKTIRARSIPNNTPALVVRQLFKLAFLSELRQDTHTALRNYRLAYEQCKDSMEHWNGHDIFEWRSVVGLLNYKMCELCFLHSTAVEAINQMRKHQMAFFSAPPGTYPTPALASIEHQLWKAKQCWHFAQLFEQAVVNGLTALATLNPGTHLDTAASLYSAVNKEIAVLKSSIPVTTVYPNPDPLAAETVFFGQRPWRVGYDGVAPSNVEADAINAIVQRLVVNHEGVISLLTAAMGQYKRYGCYRMQKKVMNEMADVYYTSGDCSRALQLWSLVVRDGLPSSVQMSILNRASWAAYVIPSIKEYVWCCLQLLQGDPSMEEGLMSVLNGKPPAPPSDSHTLSQEMLAQYQSAWSKVLSEPQFFSVNASRINSFLTVQVYFIPSDDFESTRRTYFCVEITSSAKQVLQLSKVAILFDSLASGNKKGVVDDSSAVSVERQNVALMPGVTSSFTELLVLSEASFEEGNTISISRVVLDIGQRTGVFGHIEFDSSAINKQCRIRKTSYGVTTLKVPALTGGLVVEDSREVKCLVGEVADTQLVLKNTTPRTVTNVRLEFKRNEQPSTAAAAVLFMDAANELNTDQVVDCTEELHPQNTISVPLRFSAQLVGNMELLLEVSYTTNGENVPRVSKIPLSVVAREPFLIKSGILTLNGVAVTSLLNHSEHVLTADVASSADIVISNVEWLLADVVHQVDPGKAGKTLNDRLCEGDVMRYCTAIQVDLEEEEAEMPVGRMAVEWKRYGSEYPVRSVVALCRLPVLSCPVSVSARVLETPATVRRPINIHYTLRNNSDQVAELTVSFDLSDTFMFSGEKRLTFRLFPDSCRNINVIVMALTGGRLPFPKISLRSPDISETLLQHATRVLPATLFVLPNLKEPSESQA